MVATIELLERLVGFQTIAGTSNLDLVRWVTAYLSERGFRIRSFPNAGGDRVALFATMGREGADGLILSGHTDVVTPEGQHWSSDPFVLTARDSRLHGRGATDMKGFLACMLSLADEVASAPPARPLHLAFSYDEEIGCKGIRPMLESLKAEKFAASACIVGEPTRLQVATAHKGKLAATCRATGKAAHSALPSEGVNAIYLVNDVIAAIRQLQADIVRHGRHDHAYATPTTSLHVGTIAGGTALNIVPGAAEFAFEIRNLPGEDPELHLAELKRLAAVLVEPHLAGAPSVAIDFAITSQYPALDEQQAAGLTDKVSKWTATSETTKVAYGTEAGYFASLLAVPTIICGPGSMEQGHQPDEFIERDQLDACMALLRRAAYAAEL